MSQPATTGPVIQRQSYLKREPSGKLSAFKKWEKKWCVFAVSSRNGPVLDFFDDRADMNQGPKSGSRIKLENTKQVCAAIQCKIPYSFIIITDNKIINLAALSQIECDNWIACLRRVLTEQKCLQSVTEDHDYEITRGPSRQDQINQQRSSRMGRPLPPSPPLESRSGEEDSSDEDHCPAPPALPSRSDLSPKEPAPSTPALEMRHQSVRQSVSNHLLESSSSRQRHRAPLPPPVPESPRPPIPSASTTSLRRGPLPKLPDDDAAAHRIENDFFPSISASASNRDDEKIKNLLDVLANNVDESYECGNREAITAAHQRSMTLGANVNPASLSAFEVEDCPKPKKPGSLPEEVVPLPRNKADIALSPIDPPTIIPPKAKPRRKPPQQADRIEHDFSPQFRNSAELANQEMKDDSDSDGEFLALNREAAKYHYDSCDDDDSRYVTKEEIEQINSTAQDTKLMLVKSETKPKAENVHVNPHSVIEGGMAKAKPSAAPRRKLSAAAKKSDTTSYDEDVYENNMGAFCSGVSTGHAEKKVLPKGPPLPDKLLPKSCYQPSVDAEVGKSEQKNGNQLVETKFPVSSYQFPEAKLPEIPPQFPEAKLPEIPPQLPEAKLPEIPPQLPEAKLPEIPPKISQTSNNTNSSSGTKVSRNEKEKIPELPVKTKAKTEEHLANTQLMHIEAHNGDEYAVINKSSRGLVASNSTASPELLASSEKTEPIDDGQKLKLAIQKDTGQNDSLPPSGEAPPPYTPPRLILDACNNMTSINEDTEATEELTTPNTLQQTSQGHTKVKANDPFAGVSNDIYDNPFEIRQIAKSSEYDQHPAFARRSQVPLLDKGSKPFERQLSSPETIQRPAHSNVPHSPVAHSPVVVRRSYSPHATASTQLQCSSPTPRRRDVISTPPGTPPIAARRAIEKSSPVLMRSGSDKRYDRRKTREWVLKLEDSFPKMPPQPASSSTSQFAKPIPIRSRRGMAENSKSFKIVSPEEHNLFTENSENTSRSNNEKPYQEEEESNGFRGRSSEALNRMDLGGSRPPKMAADNTDGKNSRRSSLAVDHILPLPVDNYVGRTGRRASLDPTQLRDMGYIDASYFTSSRQTSVDQNGSGSSTPGDDSFYGSNQYKSARRMSVDQSLAVPVININGELADSNHNIHKSADDEEAEERARIAYYQQKCHGRRASFDPSQLRSSGIEAVSMRRSGGSSQNLSSSSQHLSNSKDEEEDARAMFYAQRYGGRRASLDPTQLEHLQSLYNNGRRLSFGNNTNLLSPDADDEETAARSLFYKQRYAGRRASLDPSQIESAIAENPTNEVMQDIKRENRPSPEEPADRPPKPVPRPRSRRPSDAGLLSPDTVNENELLNSFTRGRRATMDPSQLNSSLAEFNRSYQGLKPVASANQLIPEDVENRNNSRRKSLPATLGPDPSELAAALENVKQQSGQSSKSRSGSRRKPLDGGILVREGKVFKAPSRADTSDEISILQQEIAHSGGVKVTTWKKDVKYALFVDINSHVWVAGWNMKERPLLYSIFHVGDKVLSVNNIAIESTKQLEKLIKRADSDTKFEFIIRRLPFGKAYHVRRNFDNEDIGMELEEGTSEVISVTKKGLVNLLGLRVNPNRAYGFGQCHWVITEVNHRPLNLVDMSDAKARLDASGKDITFVLQPQDFVELLTKQLKSEFNWKDFVVS